MTVTAPQWPSRAPWQAAARRSQPETKLPRSPARAGYSFHVSLFEPIFEALNRAQVRYVVVGGFATVLHGHARLTADIDLMIDLSPAEVRKALDTLTGLGFRPRAPIEPLAFADPATRLQWIREKGMRVFSMWDPANPMREVDLFVEHLIDFDELWTRSEIINLSHTAVRIVDCSLRFFAASHLLTACFAGSRPSWPALQSVFRAAWLAGRPSLLLRHRDVRAEAPAAEPGPAIVSPRSNRDVHASAIARSRSSATTALGFMTVPAHGHHAPW